MHQKLRGVNWCEEENYQKRGKSEEKIGKNQKALASMGRELMKSGAPWVEGEALPKNR